MIVAAFWLLALLACIHAAVSGGRDGRWAAALLLGASVLTVPATIYGSRFGQMELAVFLVDSALLAGLFVLMVRSRRWWPIWMTGFHSVAVATHMSALVAPDFVPDIYFAAASFWALPVVLSMTFGIVLDQRSVASSRR